MQVDEEGTEAAAVTAVVVKKSGGFFPSPTHYTKVYCDRPFWFVLQFDGAPVFVVSIVK